MSVRIVTPASGALSLTFSYGDGTEIVQARQLISVDPGSALETAIGVSNLSLPTAQQLASSVAGAEGAVSN